MTKFAAHALIALMAVSAVIPAFTTEAEARRRGFRTGAAIVLGLTAAAIIASSANANSSSQRSWARQCNRWYNRCINGNNYACEKFETRGCTE